MDEPQTHELKLDAAYFDAVKSGAKSFEVRRDDRGFQRGDVLMLQKHGKARNGWWAGYLTATGDAAHRGNAETIYRRVTYILTGGQHGIEPGFVVMGLEVMSDD